MTRNSSPLYADPDLGSHVVIGTSGVIALPCMDVRTNEPPLVSMGPGAQHHHLRLLARIPTVEQAEVIPCPMGHDRNSPRFTLQRLILLNFLPTAMHLECHRLITSQGPAVTRRLPTQKWPMDPDTNLYQALPIQAPVLLPGDTVEIYMVSRHLLRKADTPPPTFEERHLGSFTIRAQITWNPLPTRIRPAVVRGDPFRASTSWNPGLDGGDPSGA